MANFQHRNRQRLPVDDCFSLAPSDMVADFDFTASNKLFNKEKEFGEIDSSESELNKFLIYSLICMLTFLYIVKISKS